MVRKNKIIKTMGKWLKNKIVGIGMALINVEKNALSQKGEQLSEKSGHERRHSQGTLLDALINGELTEEVKDLRCKMYQSLQASEELITTIKFDKNGNQYTETKKKSDFNEILNKITLDTADDYPLELVVDNNLICFSVNEALDAISFDQNTDSVLAKEFFESITNRRKINVNRNIFPKFKLEDYTAKLNVRNINETDKLLEFYISKYPDEHRNTAFLISEIKKAILNPIVSSLLDITEVSFITNNTIGAKNYLEYSYDITSFDKIIEFNGYYVIKFKSTVKLSGVNILDKFKREDLIKKYDNVQPKKVTI